ncbi:uncharacterized protein [Rutidosis leptorrhynchoides]|uniref:uncharacterized protein n=1 Tax=Rutidosis leptorrhynchoides TaxID=125765 RepID=UPI003A9A1E25
MMVSFLPPSSFPSPTGHHRLHQMDISSSANPFGSRFRAPSSLGCCSLAVISAYKGVIAHIESGREWYYFTCSECRNKVTDGIVKKGVEHHTFNQENKGYSR